jgi:hypothetical protein
LTKALNVKFRRNYKNAGSNYFCEDISFFSKKI